MNFLDYQKQRNKNMKHKISTRKVAYHRIIKKIAVWLLCGILAVSSLTGCSEAGPEEKPETSITSKEGISGTDESKTDADKINDNVEKTENQDKDSQTENPSDKISELDSEHMVTEDNEMDPLLQMEYDRSRIIAKTDYYNTLDNSCPQTWCFQRKKDHSPSGTYENFKISDYNAVYLNEFVEEGDKVIYLTFDCGYPSDLTEKILDTLKKHNVKASFFVTKMYLEGCPEYAKRMKEEGHMVCNHTVTHSDLVTKDVEKIASEIFDVAEYFYELTGYTFDPYFRTPTGSYSKKLLTILKDAGYLTVFWSIAYGDYDPKNQPAPGYVTDHFTTYHHNGAIALMHNDSPSNANELDAVLTLLEKEGYRFGLLDELSATGD